MDLEIVKRDGSRVPFDKEKIVQAILRAFIEVDGVIYEEDTARDIAEDIYKIASQMQVSEKVLTVENIQNLVEDFLMRSERKDVARAYIRYRFKREAARSYENGLINELNEKYRATNVQNQNANVDEYSFGGRKGEADSVVAKKMALDYMVSDMARRNHLNNEIYIHDLDNYVVGCHNCLSIPFDDLLTKGFNTRQTDIRPANSINTAFQLLAVIFQLQSLQQFGGVSATHLDWTMVPYVRKSFYKHYCDGVKYISQKDYFWIPGSIGDQKIYENKWKDMADFMCKWFKIDDRYGYSDENAYKYAMDMTERELAQAVEGMYHNLK